MRFSCVLALFVLSSKNRLALPTTGAPQPGAPAETAEDDEEHDADDVTAEIVSTVAGHGLLCVRHACGEGTENQRPGRWPAAPLRPF